MFEHSYKCDNSDGRDTDDCSACLAERAYWLNYFKGSRPQRPVSNEEYEQDIRDAGRGHLLLSSWV
jgi:hypothetical protein